MKVLLVRFSSIGDIVLTTPVIRWFATQKKAEVHYLTFRRFESLVTSNPYIHKVHTIEKEINEVVEDLALERFDLLVDLHKSLRSRILRMKLNVPVLDFNKLNLAKWLKVNLKIDVLPLKHLVDRYADMCEKAGIKDDGLGLDFFPGPSLSQSNQMPEKYSVLVLGAAHFTKRIPESIALKIIERSVEPIVLLGGNDAVDVAQRLEVAYPHRVSNQVGRLSLDQSAEFLRVADHVHTSDTGLMHIAAAFQKPVTVYWGNTIPEFGMYPWYGSSSTLRPLHKEVHLSCRPCSKIGHDQCPKGHFKCMLDQEV